MNITSRHRLSSKIPDRLTRWLLQAIGIGAVSAAGVLLGYVPEWHSPTGQFTFSHAAYALDVSSQEVQGYARAVMQIEPIRQQAYAQIKQISGSDVPEIRCDLPSTIRNLPSNVRQIALDYCNQAIGIAESNGLTIDRFNQITMAHESDSALFNRIQAAIEQLR